MNTERKKLRRLVNFRQNGSLHSIALEEEFWVSIADMAHEYGTDAKGLIEYIYGIYVLNKNTIVKISFTEYVRIYIVRYLRIKENNQSNNASCLQYALNAVGDYAGGDYVVMGK